MRVSEKSLREFRLRKKRLRDCRLPEKRLRERRLRSQLLKSPNTAWNNMRAARELMARSTLTSASAPTLSSAPTRMKKRRNQLQREVEDLSTSMTGDGDPDRDQTCLLENKQAVHALCIPCNFFLCT